MREQVPVEKLAVGMFVAELDRPWLGTPFLIQGFVIESHEQIEEFRRLCQHVFVERTLSLGDQYAPDPVEKKEAPVRKRPEPQAHIYKDQKGDGQANASLMGSIGKIFKSAFSAEGPPPQAPARPSQPQTERAPRVIIYQDDKGVTRRKPAPEASATREKGMSDEERIYVEQAADADASVRIYSDKELSTTTKVMGRLSRLFKVSDEDKKMAAARKPPVIETPVYVDETTIEDELPLAQQAHDKVENAVQSVIEDLNKSKALELDKVNDAVGWMVESVVRNPDGMIWLTRLKSVDAYTYDHGLNTAIYLIAFGRHLGLAEDQLQMIGTVGLMQDVGKIKLPRALLEKRSKLLPAELKVFQSHVGHSIEVMRTSKDASESLIQAISQHHERYDGTGYPGGVTGDRITLLGGMAGIADTYAAMISARPYAQAVSVQQALHTLYTSRDQAFKSDLVEQFIQCVGVFPVGSLVELNTGEVAVVVSQNRARRLKPRVMLVLDKNRQSFPSPVMLDLIYDPPVPGQGEPYRIVRGLQAGMYDHDPQKTLSALMEMK
jgi:HD-GYP domain-containing protein (c-di-GMP phosphodiesterase class II)